MNNKTIHYVAMLLLWVGGLNWGLVGFLNFNLVESLFGTSMLAQITYVLVGLAAVYSFATHNTTCQVCMQMSKGKKKSKK